MFSYDRQTLAIQSRDSLDAPWEAGFAALESRQPPVYEQLYLDDATLAQLKTDFFASGRCQDPDLRPRHVDVTQALAHAAALEEFKDDVRANTELPDDIRQAYRWRINESIANQRMLLAAHAGDMTRFDRYNRFIYGLPNAVIFAAGLDYFRKQAAQALSGPGSVAEAAEAVLGTLPDLHGSQALLFPGEDTFEKVRANQHRAGGYYALVFAGIELPETGPIKPEVGQPILEAVGRNLQAGDYQLVATSSKTWSVDNEARQFKHPESYSMPLKRFVGLPIGHEWTHALEAINGYRQPIRLSGHGLDRFELSNEGRAVVREQVAYEGIAAFAGLLRWQDIVRRHVAISFGAGAAGEPRPFHEVFASINAVDRLWERSKKPHDTEAADRKADDRTWSLLTRVLKGTDGQGGAYYKDIVYLQGNVACWQAAASQPERIDYGDAGKFDITNPRHIALLQAYDMLPKGE